MPVISFSSVQVVAPANNPPVLDTPQPDISITANASGNIADISGNFSDADSDTLTYSVSPALPAGMTLNTTTGVISGNGNITETAAADYTFTANDGNGGTVDDVVNIEVTAAPSATVVSFSSVQVLPPQLAVSVDNATPEAGDTVTLTISNGTGPYTAALNGDSVTLDTQDATSATLTFPDIKTLGTRTGRYNVAQDIEITDTSDSSTATAAVTPAVTTGDYYSDDIRLTGFNAPAYAPNAADGDNNYVSVVSGVANSLNAQYGSVQSDAGCTLRAWYQDESDGVWSVAPADHVIPADIPNSPATGTPTITGTPAEDQVLTCDTSGIADSNGLGAFSYQWQRDGSDISGATSSTYTLTQTDVGAIITVSVTFTDSDGYTEGPLTSSSVGPVANVNDDPTGSVTIDNATPATGDNLTASNTLADEDGLGSISYQWRRNGADISGATGTTYTVTAADYGTAISVVASYTDAQGTSESVASSNTALVVDGVPPVITLNGSATINHSQGAPYSDAGATAQDDVDGNVTANIITTGASFDVNVIGTYTIRYNVSDAAGNAASEVTRTVNVVDETSPGITLDGGISITINEGQAWNEPGYSATDNNDGDITADVVVGGDTVETNVPGVYTITYDVTDSAGNPAPQVTRTVTVQAAAIDPTYVDPREVLKFAKPNDLVFLHAGSEIPTTAPKSPNSTVYKGFLLLGLEDDENIQQYSVLIEGQLVEPGESVNGLTYVSAVSNGKDKVKVLLSGGVSGIDYRLTLRFTTQHVPLDECSQDFEVKPL